MSDDIKRADIAELHELGVLQEANRMFFHPLGLALEVVIGDDGVERLGGVWDYRDDPEGVIFAEPVDRDKAMRVRDLRMVHYATRTRLFDKAIDVQPIDWQPPSE